MTDSGILYELKCKIESAELRVSEAGLQRPFKDAQIKIERERIAQSQRIIDKFEAEFLREEEQEAELEEWMRLYDWGVDSIKAEKKKHLREKQKSRLKSDLSLYAQKEDELLKLERWFSKCREKYTDFDVEDTDDAEDPQPYPQ